MKAPKPNYTPATIPTQTAPSGRQYYISAIFSPTEESNPMRGTWSARIKYIDNGEGKILTLKSVGL